MVLPRLPGLTLFFPCYRDELSLQELIPKAERAAKQVTDDYEILVIDDGSGEGTKSLLEALARTHEKLRIIFHDRNRGYGAALRTGFSFALKDWVFYTDGDGQYDPSELLQLAACVKPGVSLVNGFKIKRSDAWYRLWLGEIYGFFVRTWFQIPLRDIDCDFRLISREALTKLHLICDSGAICAELTAKLALQNGAFVEVPVNHYPRKFGKSAFFNFKAILRTFCELVSLSREMKHERK